MWLKCGIVGVGGFAGAIVRYLLGGWAQQKWGPSFPLGTLIINVTGSFALGVFATLSLRLVWNENWRLLIAIGFLGAYTTFSTFAFESLQLIAEGARYGSAAANILLSIVAGLLAAYLGIVVGRLLLLGMGR